MTQEILPMILRLAGEDDYKSVYDNFLGGNRAFLLALAQSLKTRGRLDEAKILCDHVLGHAPQNTDALRLAIALAGAQGNAQEALERLLFLKSTGYDSPEFVHEIRDQILLVPAAMEGLAAAGQFEEAFKLSELLVTLCPGIEIFVDSAIRYATFLQKNDKVLQYKTHLNSIRTPNVFRLEQTVKECRARGDHEAEIRCRVEIFRHPEDALRHSAVRLQNIDAAVGLILVGDVDDEKLSLAKEMVDAVPSIPPVTPTGSAFDYGAYLDRFSRLNLEALNLDVVFGPPLTPLSHPTLTFVTSNGAPIELAGIAKMVKAQKVEAIFFAAASEGYFPRFAPTYVSSILGACDCNCLVFVCISGPKHRLAEHVAKFGPADPRVIFCSDDVDPEAVKYSLYWNDVAEPSSIPGVYYASIGLLSLHFLLPALNTPFFVTGIDTILQRGVKDLLGQYRDKDVVFNRLGTNVTMQSHLINSLLLAYPTDGAMICAHFLSNYLGSALQKIEQAQFFDQQTLLMARHHLETNCGAEKIGYFGEFDMNNVMFNQHNVQAHRELLRKFRFVNIFSGGQKEVALTPEEVQATG